MPITSVYLRPQLSASPLQSEWIVSADQGLHDMKDLNEQELEVVLSG